MSTAYEQTGRTGQKQRTRQALVDVARALIEDGEPAPTVDQVATASGISRTTAYRYFSSQRSLLVAAHPEIDRTSLVPADAPIDPPARFLAVVDAFIGLTVESEGQLRAMLRLSLSEPTERDNLPLRQGRAVGWFDEALLDLEPPLGSEQRRRLVFAVRSAVGIESLVWLTDVGGLSRSDAADVMRSSARALLTQAFADQDSSS
jgi:AcrR family transcriptional regulator